MKILLINNDKGWSGGQEHLKDLGTELLRHGVVVHFGVRAGSRSDSRFRELGVPVHPLPGHGWRDLQALWRLVTLMRRERFDIVSINREHDLLLTALAWRLAFPWRKPGRLMMSYHTATARRQHLLGSADAIVCISEHVRDKLLLGNPDAAAKVSVLYYGIAIGAPPAADKFDVNRPRRYFSGAGFPLIGMVGEFWKNQGELVDMIPQLKQAFPALKVAFVGDTNNPPLFDPLQAKIRALGVEKDVIFTGRVPRERIADVFYDFDLSVTTHRNEGFGIVHLESLAAGTPVVAYAEGGFVDIFKGEHAGLLVDGGPREFAEAVGGLLNDHEKRFAMGAEGYDLVKRKYSVQAMGETYLCFYRKLLGIS
jgi:glycosyltransferase involved in cell wall biosynthesis